MSSTVAKSIRVPTSVYLELDAAVKSNDLEKVKRLLKVPGVEVNMLLNGIPYLFTAVIYGSIQIVKELLECPGIDVNKVNQNGYTALMGAISVGRLDIVKLLLAVPGINVNYIGYNGDTPLSLAVEGANYEMVKLLVENGADVNIANYPENYSNSESAYESNYSNEFANESANENNDGSGSVTENEYAEVWGLPNAVPSKPHNPFKTALEKAVMTSERVSSNKAKTAIQKIISYLLEKGATYREPLGYLRKWTSGRYPKRDLEMLPTLSTLSRKAAFNRRKHLVAAFTSKNTRRHRRQSRQKHTRRQR